MKVKTFVSCVGGLLFGLLAAQGALAAQGGTQFSADTYQKGPQGEMTGKIYVGDGKVRNEMAQGGQTLVQIVDTRAGEGWVIDPAQKSFARFGGGQAMQTEQKGGDSDPCQGVQGAKCTRLGEESVNGRPAVKWRMEMAWQGKTYTATQWLDKERGIPLRSDMGNGQVTEQKLVGTEKIAGRITEKWETTVSQGNQPAQASYRWFDPELDMAVREEVPGQFLRELRNIRVAPQDPALFQVPAGYTEVKPQGQQPPRR